MLDGREAGVRSLTDDEVKHFDEKGWVFLPGYLEAEYAADLRDRAKVYFDFDDANGTVGDDADEGIDVADIAMSLMHVSRRDEAFKRVSFNPQMARNIERLRPDAAGTRCYIDVIGAKLGAASGAGSGPTNYHQDFHAFPIHRALSVTCWIALDRVEPEMGSMRFVEGSDRDDYMTRQPYRRDLLDLDSVFAAYPWLTTTTTVTPPLSYEPGDATIHNSRIIHGAPGNSTGMARWNYAASYFPASSRYTGAEGFLTKGLGLRVGAELDHPEFPLVPNARATENTKADKVTR